MGPYEVRARIKGSEEKLDEINISSVLSIDHDTGMSVLNAIKTCRGPRLCAMEMLKLDVEQSGCVFVSGPTACIDCPRNRRT